MYTLTSLAELRAWVWLRQTTQYAIRRTWKSDGDHDYVGLAQARPNYPTAIQGRLATYQQTLRQEK